MASPIQMQPLRTDTSILVIVLQMELLSLEMLRDGSNKTETNQVLLFSISYTDS